MAILGAGGTMAVPKGEMTVSFRSGWVKYLRVALGSAGGAAAFLALVTVLEKQPDGLRLLIAWGPWPVVGLVGLAFGGRFLSRINDSIQSAFGAVVNSVQQGAEAQMRSAEAQTKTADALSRLADQNGSQAEEMKRLTIFAAQEISGVYERFDRQDETLATHGRVLEGVASSIRELVGRGTNGS